MNDSVRDWRCEASHAARRMQKNEDRAPPSHFSEEGDDVIGYRLSGSWTHEKHKAGGGAGVREDGQPTTLTT